MARGATALLLVLLVGAARTVPLAVVLVLLSPRRGLAASRASAACSSASARPSAGRAPGLNSLTFSIGISAGLLLLAARRA